MRHSHLIIDLFVFFLSVTVAIFLATSGYLENVLTYSYQWEIIGAFLAGLAYSSGFTAPIALVALGELAQTESIILIALIGALGSLTGNLIVFFSVRDRILEDCRTFIRHLRKRNIVHILRSHLFRGILPLAGAFIVATPLPSEVGVSLLGISRWPSRYVIPLLYILNFVGIALIGIVARGLM